MAAQKTYEDLFAWYKKKVLPTLEFNSEDAIRQAFKAWTNIHTRLVVDETKTYHLDEFKSKRLKQGIAPRTVIKHLHYIKDAVKRGGIDDEISTRVYTYLFSGKINPSVPQDVPRPLSIPEYVLLRDNASSELKSLLKAALYTGMRWGELRQLKWEHIDYENRVIRFPRHLCKEGKGGNAKCVDKVIPLNTHVRRILAEAPKVSSYVFTYDGKPYADKPPRKALATACRKAGIAYGRKNRGVTFKCTRATFLTLALGQDFGLDRLHILAIVGHTVPGVLNHYVLFSDKALLKTIQRYTAKVDELIEGESYSQPSSFIAM